MTPEQAAAAVELVRRYLPSPTALPEPHKELDRISAALEAAASVSEHNTEEPERMWVSKHGCQCGKHRWQGDTDGT